MGEIGISYSRVRKWFETRMIGDPWVIWRRTRRMGEIGISYSRIWKWFEKRTQSTIFWVQPKGSRYIDSYFTFFRNYTNEWKQVSFLQSASNIFFLNPTRPILQTYRPPHNLASYPPLTRKSQFPSPFHVLHIVISHNHSLLAYRPLDKPHNQQRLQSECAGCPMQPKIASASVAGIWMKRGLK